MNWGCSVVDLASMLVYGVEFFVVDGLLGRCGVGYSY